MQRRKGSPSIDLYFYYQFSEGSGRLYNIEKGSTLHEHTLQNDRFKEVISHKFVGSLPSKDCLAWYRLKCRLRGVDSQMKG
jgi:hypothetical protein